MRRVSGLVLSWLLVAASLQAWALSLAPGAWTRDSGATFSSASDGGLVISLPTWPAFVGYTWTSPPGPLTGTLLISGRIETTGAPVFRWDTEPSNTCAGSPAKLRPFVGQWPRKGRKHIAFADRWWAKDPYSVVIGPSSFSVAVPIDRVFWTGITPLPDEERGTFDAVMAAPSLIGLSFGGGCFYGHGVGVEGGAARVIVSSYSVS